MDCLSTEIIETPIGNMQAIASARGHCALEFVTPSRQQLLKIRLSRWFSNETIEWRSHSAINDAKRWLQSYFNGQFNDLFELATDLRGTPFELHVWKELRHIAIGQTISYSELATLIGNPKGSRAVGGASRRNPMSIIIPCHRVIGITGHLTGYGGDVGQKQYLVEHEIPAKRTVRIHGEGIEALHTRADIARGHIPAIMLNPEQNKPAASHRALCLVHSTRDVHLILKTKSVCYAE